MHPFQDSNTGTVLNRFTLEIINTYTSFTKQITSIVTNLQLSFNLKTISYLKEDVAGAELLV